MRSRGTWSVCKRPTMTSIMTTMSELIRPAEAARQLGVSRDSIRRYIDSGLLTGVKTPGGQRRIDQASVDSVIQRRVRISSTVTVIGAE